MVHHFYVYGYDNHHHNVEELSRAKEQFSEESWVDKIPASRRVLVTSCNRQEVYFLSEIQPPQNETAFLYQGEKALKKLFLTSAGLNTPVFSDQQIFGQVRKCFRNAQKESDLDPFLVKIFQQCFRVTRQIHEETNIKKYRSSFAKILFEELKEHLTGYESIALLGTGEMAKEILECFKKNKLSFVYVFGRDKERLKKINEKYHYEGRNLLTFKPENYNIIVCALQMVQPFLKQTDFRHVFRPTIIFDLGMPCNVESFKHPFVQKNNFTDFNVFQGEQEQEKRVIHKEAQRIIEKSISVL